MRIISLVKGKPVLDFSRGECTFCGDCAAACPAPVFDREKPLAFSHIAAISERCLARLGVSCMTCRDACPEEAIRVRPRIGGPFVPEVVAALCTGCGACMGPCPSGAIAPARPEGDLAHA
jgi:ferredoxin-type protein NapF